MWVPWTLLLVGSVLCTVGMGSFFGQLVLRRESRATASRSIPRTTDQPPGAPAGTAVGPMHSPIDTVVSPQPPLERDIADVKPAAETFRAPQPTVDSPRPLAIENKSVASQLPAYGSGFLTLDDRILVHLASLPRTSPGQTHPPGYSQEGMSVALSVQQGRISGALKRLVALGMVNPPIREHCNGKSSRLKVYRLTMGGEARARGLRNQTPGPSSEPRSPPILTAT